jgi:hypothetical protein
VQAARDLDEDTLARKRRVLGEDHPDTLARKRRVPGEDHPDTLARKRRVPGEDHPSTLTSASNLAADLQALGETQESLDPDEHPAAGNQ